MPLNHPLMKEKRRGLAAGKEEEKRLSVGWVVWVE